MKFPQLIYLLGYFLASNISGDLDSCRASIIQDNSRYQLSLVTRFLSSELSQSHLRAFKVIEDEYHFVHNPQTHHESSLIPEDETVKFVQYSLTGAQTKKPREKIARKCLTASKSPENAKNPRKLYECISDEIQINTTTEGEQSSPFTLSLGQDQLVILWVHRENPVISKSSAPDTEPVLKGQIVDINLNKIGPEFQVNSDSNPPSGYYIRAALLDSGSYVVFWMTSTYDLFGRIMNGETPQGTEFKVDSTDRDEHFLADVCPLTNGGFVISYIREVDNNSYRVMGQKFDELGNPDGYEFQVYSDSSYMSFAKCTALKNSGFVITWMIKDLTDILGIAAQVFDSSAFPQSVIFKANHDSSLEEGYPSIATLNDGRFIITYDSIDQEEDSSYGIFGQLFDSDGNKIDEEFLVNTHTGNYQYLQDVIPMYDGGFLVTWTSTDQDGDRQGVYAQRYDQSAQKLGSEILINIHTDDYQGYSNSGGIFNGFITSWESNGQDGSKLGIFARAFFDSNAIADGASCSSCRQNQYDSLDSCEDCLAECATCNSAGCLTCPTSENCCADGTYLSEGKCLSCPSDCVTCSGPTACDTCTDLTTSPPECCPDDSQNDDDRDGFCLCNDGKTPFSGCTCDAESAYYALGTEPSACIGPIDMVALEIVNPNASDPDAPIEVSMYCPDDELQLHISSYATAIDNSVNTLAFYWRSTDSSLDLSGQTSRTLTVPVSSLNTGSVTFNAFMNLYGVGRTGSRTVTVTENWERLTATLSAGPSILLGKDQKIVISASISNNPCTSPVTYQWACISKSCSSSFPTSSSESLTLKAKNLPNGTYNYYCTVSSGGQTFTTDFFVTVDA